MSISKGILTLIGLLFIVALIGGSWTEIFGEPHGLIFVLYQTITVATPLFLYTWMLQNYSEKESMEYRQSRDKIVEKQEPTDWQIMDTAPKNGDSILLCVEWDDLWLVIYWGTNGDDPGSRECWRCRWNSEDIEDYFTPMRSWAWKPLGPKPPVDFGDI